jgi:antitoxin component of MazEF toxin-antitoxin module
MEIETIAKRWGSSIGIILPKEIVEAKKIKENDIVKIEIKNRPLAKEFFGRFKNKLNRPIQELKDEARRGWN